MHNLESPSARMERCNETELYQLCRRAGILVPPGTSRKTMIALLVGDEEPEQTEHLIDTWREGIANFVMDHWSVLEPQLTCPIRSGDPKSCFGCLDQQVLACIVENPSTEHLMKIRRK